MAERFKCSVCLSFSSETKSDYFVSTRGGHIFHHSCIKRVIDRDVYPVCPVCREPVSEASLTRLYGIECPERKDGITVKNPHANIDHIFKIVVLGDSGVGKSAVLRRFSDDAFHENMVTTVGCDLMFKKVRMGDKTIKLNLWDTAGDEKYRAIIPSYVRNAHAIFLVYAISDSTSFAHIDDWIKFAKDFGPSNAVRVLIGNKADQEDIRMVSTRRGKELGEREGISFFETSAKQSLNIEAALRTATAEILEKPELVQQADFATSKSRRRLAQQDYSAEPPTTLTCC